MCCLLEMQYSEDARVLLFDLNEFSGIFERILQCDQTFCTVDSRLVVLNIIVKIARWFIVNNNIQWPDDGKFLSCVWNTLNAYQFDDSNALNFNRNEIIRLLSHSMFGYPKTIDEHQNACTCKRFPIEWNGATLLFNSFEYILNG